LVTDGIFKSLYAAAAEADDVAACAAANLWRRLRKLGGFLLRVHEHNRQPCGPLQH